MPKADIHPTMHPVMFLDVSTGDSFLMQSTLTSEETKTIDGTKYYVIRVDVSSSSHPFYTGKQHLIDSSGQVEKFYARMKKATHSLTPSASANADKSPASTAETPAPAHKKDS